MSVFYVAICPEPQHEMQEDGDNTRLVTKAVRVGHTYINTILPDPYKCR